MALPKIDLNPGRFRVPFLPKPLRTLVKAVGDVVGAGKPGYLRALQGPPWPLPPGTSPHPEVPHCRWEI